MLIIFTSFLAYLLFLFIVFVSAKTTNSKSKIFVFMLKMIQLGFLYGTCVELRSTKFRIFALVLVCVRVAIMLFCVLKYDFFDALALFSIYFDTLRAQRVCSGIYLFHLNLFTSWAIVLVARGGGGYVVSLELSRKYWKCAGFLQRRQGEAMPTNEEKKL